MKIHNKISCVLCSILCIFTLIGCSNNSPYAKAEAQTLTIQGVPVYVEPDDNTVQGDVDFFLEHLKEQTSYLMNKCKEIHLQGSKKFVDGALKNEFNENTAKSIDGYLSPLEQIVFLKVKIKDEYGPNASDEEKSKIITHELWHAYDWASGNGDLYFSEMQMNDLYNQAPESLTEYGATDVVEFFAEGGAMYVNSSEELKEKNIDVYNFFEALPKE